VADLAFSPEECAELLRERSGREPAGEDVEALWTATEGWPLGVTLAASSDRATAPATSGALFEYLAEELTARLEPELRNRLTDSSAAPDLDPDMIASLGLPDDFLEEVRHSGLPLSLIQGEGERPAYHPLVREFLRDRLERERPDSRRRELHGRVAEALEAADRGPEAVEHWLSAGAPEAAAAVIRHGPALARTAPGTVAGWLERLGDDARGAPELRLLEGSLAVGAGRLEEALVPLREAVEGFEAQGDEASTWLARLKLAETLTLIEDFEAAIPLAEGWESAHVPPAPMVAVLVAVALAGAGRYREASDLSMRVVEHPFGAPLAPFARGSTGVDLVCGRLDDALASLRDAAAQLERDDPFDTLPYVLGMEAVVRDERGEDAPALEAFDRARRLAEEAMLGGYITDIGRRFAAGVHARAGRLVEAERELEELTGPGLGWYAGDAEITRATIAAGRGAHTEAVEWAERAAAAGALEPWRTRVPFWRNTALLAPVLVRAGRPAWGRELIEGALAARPPLASCARLLALRSWLRTLEGDEVGALEDIASAWEEAGDAPEHLVRRERPRLEPLLWTALERGILPPGEVIAALEAAEPGGSALLAFIDHPLTDVRRSALRSIAASGHPDAYARVQALEHDPDETVAAAARASRTLLARDPPPLAFSLLGGFRVRRGTHLVSDEEWGGRRRAAQRLVRFLLVHREAVVPEDDLFDAFWPDATAEAARRGLQVTLSSARAVLDFPGAEHSVLEVADRRYRLALAERDLVDADEFEAAAAAALAATDRARTGLLEAAAARWEGEPLPEDRYEDWAAAARARLSDLYARVLAALADARAAAGDHAGAIGAASRHVELAPLDEAVHRRLMLAYARSGRRGEALRQYLACRRALVDGLGIEPAEETAALQRRILAGEAL
jgi:DNA-binding SARP family transcriptional activator